MSQQNIAPGTDNGTHVVGAPLTTQLSEIASPDLLRESIDERIAKIRPMSTPVDQLSRCAGSRPCQSMVVEYYAVDTKKTETTLAEAVTSSSRGQAMGELTAYEIKTADDAIFDESETILVPEVNGYDKDGNEADEPLVLYVLEKGSGGVTVAPINGLPDDYGIRTMPAIAAGAKLVRMGRAAAELDVQTAQFSAMPRKDSNNCQIFKMQVEQSTLQKIAEKEVDWHFSDQEEAAIIDMRLGMEKSFIFGSRSRVLNPNKNEYVYFTGGIWNQCKQSHTLDIANLDENALIDLCSKAFTGNTGSKSKILIAGTKLVEALSKLDRFKVVGANETHAVYGLEFKEIRSNFGSLMVLHSEVFDQCGHASDGMIIDPDYITKYVHIPFNVETLDLRRSGVRNTDAVVITEAACLVLRYPKAHLKVIGG